MSGAHPLKCPGFAPATRGARPERGPVHLSQLCATWVMHDRGHVAQIWAVMAKQYTAAVGPWTAYLPVLTRPR